MKMNKFLIFALLIGSFALNADTTYYQQQGLGWRQITQKEFEKSNQNPWDCEKYTQPYIESGKNCSACGVYASCEDIKKPLIDPNQQGPIYPTIPMRLFDF